MRIVSLLPSATEIVYSLGLQESLARVTFECNFPTDAQTKAIVTGTALTPGQTSAQIDSQAPALVAAGKPANTLSAERIRAIAPDLIRTQDLCAEACGHAQPRLPHQLLAWTASGAGPGMGRSAVSKLMS